MSAFSHAGNSVAVGVVTGLASVTIPDEIVSFLGKVALGVVVAIASASVHALTKVFWKRVFKEK